MTTDPIASPAKKYPVRELSFAGILDVSASILRDRFALFFLIGCILHLPFYFVSDIYLLVEGEDLPGLWFLLHTVLSVFVIYPITFAAWTDAAARVYLGQPVTVLGSFRNGLHTSLRMMGSYALTSLIICFGFLLVIIPGLIWAAQYSLAGTAVVLEGAGPVSSLDRSSALTQGTRTRALGLLTIIMAIMLTVMLVLSAIVPEPYDRFAYSVVGLIGGQCFAIVCTVYYFSCRCQKEQFDLQVMAHAMHAPDVPSPTAVLSQER